MAIPSDDACNQFARAGGTYRRPVEINLLPYWRRADENGGMALIPKNPVAGARFVDRYMPNASAPERREAIENFYGFVDVIYRIASRRANEERERMIRAVSDAAVKSTNGPTPIP